MIYRKLGQSELQVSAITFGAWAIGGFMWGGSDEKDAIQAIQKGFDMGITTIDTAPIYGMGLSEELVGKAIQGQREKFQIMTKFGIKWQEAGNQQQFRSQKDYEKLMEQIYLSARKEGIMRECEDSLRRLNTDYIDYYQHHRPAEDAPISEVMEALEKLQDQGKIRAAGVSNYSLEQMTEANRHLQVQANQLPYSMVKRDIENEIIPWVLQNKRSVIAYSPLQRGVLTGKYTPGHQLKEGDHRKHSRFFQTENIRKINAFLAKLEPIATRHQASLAQLVLNWTLHQPGITVVLAGARNPLQVEENALAADIQLSEQEMGTINTHLEKLELDLS